MFLHNGMVLPLTRRYSCRPTMAAPTFNNLVVVLWLFLQRQQNTISLEQIWAKIGGLCSPSHPAPPGPPVAAPGAPKSKEKDLLVGADRFEIHANFLAGDRFEVHRQHVFVAGAL